MIKHKLIPTALTAISLLALPGAALATTADSDGDHMPNRWESAHGLSTKVNDAKRDRDRDGLSNLTEYRAHTNPRKADSDRDGVLDRNEDSDRDGVKNGVEQRRHTNPGVADDNLPRHSGVDSAAAGADDNTPSGAGLDG